MTQTTPDSIVGREAELAMLDDFVSAGSPWHALVLAGASGLGKTTLWEAGVDLARQRGLRVLSATGSGAATQLAFAVLIDLLDGVGPEELTDLPAPQRQALEVALLRVEPTDMPLQAAAISVGFLNALRALSAREPVLVAIDDVQWLDTASAEAIAFAARRIDGHPVRFLLAKRSRGSSLLERAHGPKGLQRLEIGPLSLGATQRLLSEQLELRLSRHVLRRVVDATLGNPLFALELGRTLADEGPLGMADDVPLPETVEELLGTRVAALPDHVRRLVLAVALSGDLRASQAEELAAPAALDDAVDLGVLVVDGDRVRPAHPLFATAAKRSARAGERRELHLAMAELASDEESRALHLALATDLPDEDLAAAISSAAVGAAARGARRDAVVLAEHALRLTEEPDERDRRLLALGENLDAAGEQAQLTELLVPALESLPPGETRVRACLLLSNGAVETNDEIVGYLERALAEAGGDVRLRAFALSEMAANDAVARVERVQAAEEGALEALEAARDAGPEVERVALYGLSWARSLRGRPIDDLCEHFRTVSGPAPYLAFSPERIAGQRLVWRGEVVEARNRLAGLLSIADERGEPISYALQRMHLCELELRTGRWDEATRLLDEWPRDGELITWPCYERCRALLAAGRGLPGEAQRWATEAIAQGQQTGLYWDVLEALRAQGMVALLTEDLTLAGESLGAVWMHAEREGVDEPGVFPVAPDFVEALVELGRLEQAQAVSDRLFELAAEQQHPWGLASASRCAAVVQLASGGDGDEAATELADAAETYGELGLHFDRARSLLSLGRVQRRLKKWGAARDALGQAEEEFDELGSPGWADEARSEQSKVGGRRPKSSGELTRAERRVAELAAEGMANKEIASTLFVTVRTVEDHLKHAYAKLGIRSRTQLASRLSDPT